MTSPAAFPATWSVKELRDAPVQIIDGDRGSNYPTKDEFSPEGFCLFLSTSNIQGDVFHFGAADFISERKDALLRNGKLTRGDIVLTTRGTVGSVGYFHSRIPYEHVRINSGMVILRCGGGMCSHYLYHLLKSQALKTQLELYSSGSAQPQLPIKDLRRVKLPIPDLPTQRKIGAILFAYDELIENNKRRIALLERAAQEIYREWFVRLRFPGHENIRIVKGIPAGWSRKPVGALATEVKAGVKKRELTEGQRYLGLEHLPRRSIAVKEWSTVDSVDSDKLKFQSRDILFGKIRPYLHKVAIAHFDGICSTDAIVIRSAEARLEGFVLFTLFSDTFVELASVASKGTKMPRADWSFLKRLEIPVPGDALLAAYQAQFDGMYSQIVSLLRQNELLTTLRDRLLPRLISGRLSVETLDIQFPPSMREQRVVTAAPRAAAVARARRGSETEYA